MEEGQSPAKNSKFIDVTIESLGLEPVKYTAKGTPSVTADVLRQLAGEPFADPPKYGLVRVAYFTVPDCLNVVSL